MKIFSFPFAVTLVSSLKKDEIELLQKKDPRALALFEALPDGTESQFFGINFVSKGTGDVCPSNVTFVGEMPDGKAALSILIPANLKGADVGKYTNDKLAAVSRNCAIVEENAKRALVTVAAAEAAFLDSIIDLTPETEIEVAAEAAPEAGGTN